MSVDVEKMKEAMANSGLADKFGITVETKEEAVDDEGAVAESARVEEKVEEVVDQKVEEVEETKTEEVETNESKVSDSQDISKLTGGRFSTVDELIAAYEEESKKGEIDTSYQDFINGDEFIKGAVDYYREHNNLSDYASVKGVDYDKMEPLDLLREKFMKDNAGKNPELVDLLWQKEVEDKYAYNEDASDTDKKIRDLLLADDAGKAKDFLKDLQSKFKAPERKPEGQPAFSKEQVEADKRVASEFLSAMKDHREITLGEHSFRMDLDKDFSKKIMDNAGDFFGLFVEEDGSVDYDRYVLAAHFARDPEGFMKNLNVWARSSEKDRMIDETRNVDLESKDEGDKSRGVPGSFEDKVLHAIKKKTGKL